LKFANDHVPSKIDGHGTRMKEETKKQVRKFYAGVARLTGAVSAILAVWFGGVIVVRLSSASNGEDQTVGGALLAMSFCIVMALLLLNVRAEKPRDELR